VSLRPSFCVPLIRALAMRGSQQRNRTCRVYPYQYFVGAQSALRTQLEPSFTTPARDIRRRTSTALRPRAR
jgi:hypothetical protein